MERIVKLCCPQPTPSVGLYFILLYQTLLIITVSAHLYQFTFMPHVPNKKKMVIYVIMTSFRCYNKGPIGINYVGSNHLIYCTVEGNCNTLGKN